MSAQDIASMYQLHVVWGGDPEDRPSTTSFIDAALTVHARMLSIPVVKALLVDAQEGEKNNPLDKITKLLVIAQKAQSVDRIQWAVEMILDLYASGALVYEQVGSRALEGRTAQAAGKGLVDLFVLKHTALQHLTTEWLDSWAVPSDVKAAIRRVCSSLSAFRSGCGYHYNPSYKKVSSAWRAGWPRGSESILEFIEAGCMVVWISG